jgi:hypothetical protein
MIPHVFQQKLFPTVRLFTLSMRIRWWKVTGGSVGQQGECGAPHADSRYCIVSLPVPSLQPCHSDERRSRVYCSWLSIVTLGFTPQAARKKVLDVLAVRACFTNSPLI